MSEERLLDLLAGRTLRDLSAAELHELERLLAGAPRDAERAGFELELAAALADLALGAQRRAPLPADLFARLQAQGEALVGERRRATGGVPPQRGAAAARPAPAPLLPWLVAAAATIAALFGWLRSERGAPVLAPASARATLVAAAGDLVELPWKAAGELAQSGVGGDVVWSDTRQEGYMRFTGLPRNVPTAEQYQLWIFDKERSLDTPVDGGVFDVDANGELVVPIDAKIGVHEAIAFAITVEKPGGVVVSDRTRLILTAGL